MITAFFIFHLLLRITNNTENSYRNTHKIIEKRNSMASLDDIFKMDCAYLSTFTTKIDTSWGMLFYNENQPNYYDANHAHIQQICDHPKSVIDEVSRFYQDKGIIPRFYLYNVEQLQAFISDAKAAHYRYEEFNSPVQLWNHKIIETETNSSVTIEKVTEENFHEAMEIEGSITEFGGMDTIKKVFREQFNHPAFTHYLLRYEGKACSTACIFVDGDQARLESAATLEAYRGKGLIGAIIQFIQNEIIKREITRFWVFPINETIEKIYQKYGFQTVGNLKNGHAYLEGKSIKEIQAG